MRFLHVRLQAPVRRHEALADFYGGQFGFDLRGDSEGRFSLTVGETTVEFVGTSGEPFYHFALLVPGNRFREALAWATARTELLPSAESGEVVFDFTSWDAQACYFHDPAGNIVELIAHHGIGDTTTQGVFRASELIGVSELGLVGDPAAMTGELAEELCLELWDGTVEEPGRLAFVGERARTLILSPPGRGWLPTGQPAEPHNVQALLSGAPKGETLLDDSRYRISRNGSDTV
jgi:hypothetical protein